MHIIFFVVQEGDSDDVYKFVLKEGEIEAMPQHGPYEMKTQLLMMEDDVSMHWLTYYNIDH